MDVAAEGNNVKHDRREGEFDGVLTPRAPREERRRS
jgi:hypothetical protein